MRRIEQTTGTVDCSRTHESRCAAAARAINRGIACTFAHSIRDSDVLVHDHTKIDDETYYQEKRGKNQKHFNSCLSPFFKAKLAEQSSKFVQHHSCTWSTARTTG